MHSYQEAINSNPKSQIQSLLSQFYITIYVYNYIRTNTEVKQQHRDHTENFETYPNLFDKSFGFSSDLTRQDPFFIRYQNEINGMILQHQYSIIGDHKERIWTWVTLQEPAPAKVYPKALYKQACSLPSSAQRRRRRRRRQLRRGAVFWRRWLQPCWKVKQ